MIPVKLSLILLWSSSLCSSAFRLNPENIEFPSERVKVRSLSRRSADESHTIHLSAFGKDHVLQLTPKKSVFTPDFKMIQVIQNSNGKTEFSEVLEDQAEEIQNNAQLYSVNDGEGSLYVMDNGNIHVEGLINDELRITPNENDYHEDGSLAHTVHQINTLDQSSETDFVIPEPTDNSYEEISTSPLADVPAEVTVEVLVVFDHANSKRLDFDLKKIRKYIGIFWSQIHYRYRDTSMPKMNIAVSGLVTFKNPEDESFIFKNKVDEKRVEKAVLGAFKDWLVASKASLPKHDAAILQLGLDSGHMENGKWNGGLAGLAWVGTACNTNGNNAGFAEDTARLFTGFNAAAHELAHVLNAPHDGSGAAKDCPAGQGFVMSGGGKKTFSNCSLEIMRKFVSANNRKCMWDAPKIEVPLIDVWPVLMVEDLNEQCRLMFRNDDYFFPGKITAGNCEKMWCGKKNSGVHYLVRGAYDGTPCGLNKVCLDKKCIDMKAPSLDAQCQEMFGNRFKSTTTENVCQEVRCIDSNTSKEHSLGRPLPGTPCGTKNLCLNGKCNAV